MLPSSCSSKHVAHTASSIWALTLFCHFWLPLFAPSRLESFSFEACWLSLPLFRISRSLLWTGSRSSLDLFEAQDELCRCWDEFHSGRELQPIEYSTEISTFSWQALWKVHILLLLKSGSKFLALKSPIQIWNDRILLFCFLPFAFVAQQQFSVIGLLCLAWRRIGYQAFCWNCLSCYPLCWCGSVASIWRIWFWSCPSSLPSWDTWSYLLFASSLICLWESDLISSQFTSIYPQLS